MDSVAVALRTIQHEAFAVRILGWSALIVPLIAAVTVWIRSQTWLSHRIIRGFAALAVFGVYSTIALTFAACFIGDTGKQQLGRAFASPVLEALEHYHAAHGTYPDSLAELVPTDLAISALHRPEQSILNRPFGYARNSTAFKLSFYYLGPGANTCTVSPNISWSCGGLY